MQIVWLSGDVIRRCGQAAVSLSCIPGTSEPNAENCQPAKKRLQFQCLSSPRSSPRLSAFSMDWAEGSKTKEPDSAKPGFVHTTFNHGECVGNDWATPPAPSFLSIERHGPPPHPPCESENKQISIDVSIFIYLCLRWFLHFT